jgi:hypothetical protein
MATHFPAIDRFLDVPIGTVFKVIRGEYAGRVALFSRIVGNNALLVHVRGGALGYHPITELDPVENFHGNVIVHPDDLGSSVIYLEDHLIPVEIENVPTGMPFVIRTGVYEGRVALLRHAISESEAVVAVRRVIGHHPLHDFETDDDYESPIVIPFMFLIPAPELLEYDGIHRDPHTGVPL